MPTKKHTVSVRLGAVAAQRVAAAARLTKQSQGAFLEQAGADAARRILLEEAVRRHQAGEASLSELASETGLTVEEIIDATGERQRDTSLATFLASSRTIAETMQDEEFLRMAEEAVDAVRASNSEAA